MVEVDAFPSTRQSALQRLEEFLAAAPRYAAARNHVVPGHANVSRLSAAIRHRLITEGEVVAAVLRRYPFRAVEKFVQEVLWRTYWKGWLEMRPGVWAHYRTAAARLEMDAAARAVAEGRSRSAVMNRFARELLETGYLHNHARMWWASYWVHHCGLPWEAGARHFFEHLLDADPASNTLGWRWVAGLQTRGKAYLATEQNIRKYCAPEILAGAGGIGLEDNVAPRIPESEAPGTHAAPDSPDEHNPDRQGSRQVLVLHDEDLCLESSPAASLRPSLVLHLVTDAPLPAPRAEWLAEARADAALRTAAHFGCEVRACRTVEELAHDAGGIGTVVMMQPFVGPLRDALGKLPGLLDSRSVALVRLRRRWDSQLLPHARRGFFPFWQTVTRLLQKSGPGVLCEGPAC